MRLNKLLLILVFIYTASSLWTPFFVCAAEPSHYGGALVDSVGSDPKTFNQIVSTEASSNVIGVLFEGLTTIDAFTLKVKPNLAARWELSSDGLQWIFHLRKDVYFFDGVRLTADDVVFTFNDLIYNPKIPCSAKDVFTIDGKIFKVEKIDDNTVHFTLPVKFAPFLRGMTQPIFPKHILEKSVKEGSFTFNWGINTNPHDLIGTGPFSLDQYRPGERLIFKRNPHYWKKDNQGNSLPYLDKMITLIIPDNDAQLLKFLDGELDMMGLRGIDYPLLKPMEKDKNFKIYDAGPNDGSNFITFNQNPKNNPKTGKPFVDPIKLSWFSNVNFRRAIAHAIDKKKLIEILSNGLGYPQAGPMSPSSGFFYNAHVPAYAYNLEKAKALLAQEGFIDRNGDGIVEDKAGHSIVFNLLTGAGGAGDRSEMANMIRADLRRIGLNVQVKQLEFNTLVSKLMATFDWDAVIIGLTGGEEPHFGKNVWHSTGQLHLWNPKQEKPNTPWEMRLDEIFIQGVQELDENKRKTLYDEYQVIAADQLPVIYTVLGANIYAVRQKFGNLKPSAHRGAFHNIEEIYINQNKPST